MCDILKQNQKTDKKQAKLKKIKNTKKRNRIIWTIFGVLVLGFGIYTGIHYYEQHKPVGITKESVKVKKHNSNSTTIDKYLKVKKYGKNIQMHGYDFLFESQIKPIKNHKKEMPASDIFEANLMKCLISNTPSAVNQGAALYTRNSENYNFTTNQNLINKGIGQDLVYINNFMNQVKGLSIDAAYQYEENMGNFVRQYFNTPMTMAIAGVAVLSQDGQIKMFKDNNASIAHFNTLGCEYKGMVQYCDKSSLSKAPQIPVYTNPTQKQNYAKIAWKSYPNTNSVYQVKVQDPAKVDEGYVYIVETKDGKLHPFGYYSIMPNDNYGMTIGEYKDVLTKNPDYHQQNDTGNDITWNNFVNAMN